MLNYEVTFLLLLLSHFSRVRLCATPSLGFSRQEHWSGLPFPSPVHKSEKWMWSRSVMSNSLWPHGLQPTRLFRPWNFPGTSTSYLFFPLLKYANEQVILVENEPPCHNFMEAVTTNIKLCPLKRNYTWNIFWQKHYILIVWRFSFKNY